MQYDVLDPNIYRISPKASFLIEKNRKNCKNKKFRKTGVYRKKCLQLLQKTSLLL